MDHQLIKSNNLNKSILKLYLKPPDQIINAASKGIDYKKFKGQKKRMCVKQLNSINVEYLLGKRAMQLVRIALKSKQKKEVKRFVIKKWNRFKFNFPKSLYMKLTILIPYYQINESFINYLINTDIKLIEITKYNDENIKKELISELKQLFLNVSTNNHLNFNEYIDQWGDRLIKELYTGGKKG